MSHDPTYHFQFSDAATYGPEAAIILYNFRFWLRTNLRDHKNLRHGRVWTYKSQKAMTQWFPWWTERQIRHRIKKMTEAGILIKDNHNGNRYDQTAWYSIAEDEFIVDREAAFDEAHISAHITPATDASLVQPTDVSLQSDRPDACSYKEDINTDSSNTYPLPPNAADGSAAAGEKEAIPDYDTSLTVEAKSVSNDPYLPKAHDIAGYLHQQIVEWDPDHKFARTKPALKRWAKDISKAMRIDGRKPEHLTAMIDMLFRTDHPTAIFWAKNIQSGEKLRMQYDRIRQDYYEKEQRKKAAGKRAPRQAPDRDEILRRAEDNEDFIKQMREEDDEQ